MNRFDAENFFTRIIGFIRSLFDGAINIWDWLTTEIGIPGILSFTPIDIILGGLAIVLTAMLINKIVG